MRNVGACLLILVILIIISDDARSQPSHSSKRIIDTTAIRESEYWPRVGDDVSISADGRFVLYTMMNEPAGTIKFIAESVDKGWKKEFSGATGAEISADSRWLVYRQGDSLYLQGLGREEQVLLPHVGHYECIERDGASWLAYMQNGDDQDLMLRDLDNGKNQIFPRCSNFWLDGKRSRLFWASKQDIAGGFSHSLQWMELSDGKVHCIRMDASEDALNETMSPNGQVLLIITMAVKGGDSIYRLHWYELETDKDQIIGDARTRSGTCQFDSVGTQLLWASSDTIAYYKSGMERMTKLVPQAMSGMDGRYILHDPTFSGDGQRVLFQLTEREKKDSPSMAEAGVKLVIWHYRATVLPSARSLLPKEEAVAMAVLNLRSGRIQCTTGLPGERLLLSGSRYMLLKKELSFGEGYWRQPAGPEVTLVSLEDGRRYRLQIDLRYINPVVQLSPKEDYLIYYDPAHDGYFSYGTADGKTRRITNSIQASWRKASSYHFFNTPNPFFGVDPRPRGIAGWVDGDSRVLVYASYDIWKLDPSGRCAPENVTKGYGNQHQIIFDLDAVNDDMAALSTKEEWILNSFNRKTNEAGYYRMQAGKSPELLFMGPYTLGPLRKASSANAWVISRSCATEMSGVYVKYSTKPFVCLRRSEPPSQYNWYTSELVTWKLPDGQSCQGVLYKPKNMDTTRRYPIIFYYYEWFSNRAYSFISPSLPDGAEINVPYFVSRGYLVFKPDIHYRTGHPGESALVSIVSAADYLSKRRYMDRHRMGLAGHSWGGYETNYVVTHSHLFAAAAEGAGPTNFIAGYNGLSGVNGIGASSQPLYETSQSRMGVTLWQRPDLYIENSPIMRADHITTPLLMLHNKEDDAVPWSQGVELFTALRRLGKRAWMLQYEGEGHNLLKPENVLDYTVRLTQFFDHYLKGAPAPKWMTNAEEQVKNELNPDTLVREP